MSSLVEREPAATALRHLRRGSSHPPLDTASGSSTTAKQRPPALECTVTCRMLARQTRLGASVAVVPASRYPYGTSKGQGCRSTLPSGAKRSEPACGRPASQLVDWNVHGDSLLRSPLKDLRMARSSPHATAQRCRARDGGEGPKASSRVLTCRMFHSVCRNSVSGCVSCYLPVSRSLLTQSMTAVASG